MGPSPVVTLLFALCIALIIIWAAIKLFVFWFRSLTSVMSTTDTQLPSKYDKVLWVTLFLFVPIIAPFLYTASVEKYNQKNP
jgi:hypothetical protein